MSNFQTTMLQNIKIAQFFVQHYVMQHIKIAFYYFEMGKIAVANHLYSCGGTRHNGAIKIAANKISDYDADIENKNIEPVLGKEIDWYTEIIERICHTVREAAHDEERNTEEERKVLFFTSESHSCSHDKSAADGKYATLQRTDSETTSKNPLCRFLQRHWRTTNNQRNEQTTDDVAEKNEEKFPNLAFTFFSAYNFAELDESCRASVKSQAVMYDREKSESK